MKVTFIVGTRPNFMKIAPVIPTVRKANANNKKITYRILHSGQHFDYNMSNPSFKELNIRQPNIVVRLPV